MPLFKSLSCSTTVGDEIDVVKAKKFTTIPAADLAAADSQISLKKIHQNLAKAEQETQLIDEYAILIGTGAFSPPHVMHVEMFDIAKKFLENGFQGKKIKVLGGFLSPSHDGYVTQKAAMKNTKPISAKDRIEMCRLATESSDYMTVSSWEAMQPWFISFAKVTNFHADYLCCNSQFQAALAKCIKGNYINAGKGTAPKSALKTPSEKLRVYFVCGADLIMRTIFNFNWDYVSVLSVSRPGVTEKAKKHMGRYEEMKQPVYLVEEGLSREQDLSSTMIRKLISESKGDYSVLKGQVQDDVIQYLQTHKLVEMEPATNTNEETTDP